MMNGKILWTSGKRISAVSKSAKQYQKRNGIKNYQVNTPYRASTDNPAGRATGMGYSGNELFSKSCCYFYVGKGDRLIGKGFVTFPIKGFDYAP